MTFMVNHLIRNIISISAKTSSLLITLHIILCLILWAFDYLICISWCLILLV